MLPYLGQDDDRSRNYCNSSFLSTRTIFVGNIGSPQQTVPYEGERNSVGITRGPGMITPTTDYLALRRLLFDCNDNMAYMSKVPENPQLFVTWRERSYHIYVGEWFPDCNFLCVLGSVFRSLSHPPPSRTNAFIRINTILGSLCPLHSRLNSVNKRFAVIMGLSHNLSE